MASEPLHRGVVVRPGAAEAFTLPARVLEAHQDPLALELREASQDLHEEAPRRRREIHLVAGGDELHAERFELGSQSSLSIIFRNSELVESTNSVSLLSAFL